MTSTVFAQKLTKVKLNRYSLMEFMESEGVMLKDLSERTGISLSFLSELRSGKATEISAEKLKRIAEALGGVRVRALRMNPDEVEEASA